MTRWKLFEIFGGELLGGTVVTGGQNEEREPSTNPNLMCKQIVVSR
jgi:hypothetical protein